MQRKTRLHYALAGALAMSPTMGCVIVSSDDDSGDDARAHFDVGWKVDGLSESGDGCAELPHVDHVQFVFDAPGLDEPWQDIWDCTDAEAVTATLPLGEYDIWANVRDDENNVIAQSQVVQDSLIEDGEVRFIEEEFQFLNAQFEGDWELEEEVTERALTCDEVNAGGISMVATHLDITGTAFDDRFDCPDNDTSGDFETYPLALGEHEIEVRILEDETDEELGAVVRSGSLNEHGTVSHIGTYIFTFEPEGEEGRLDIVWRVDGFDDQFGDGCSELPDFDEVQVVAESSDTTIDESFACEDGGVVLEDVPFGEYDVLARTRDTQSRIVAESVVETVNLDAPVTIDVPELAFLNAAFDLEWELDRDNEERTCDQEGVDEVEVVTERLDAEGTTFTQAFDCDDGVGETDALPLGDYEVFVTLFDDADNAVSTTRDRDASLEQHAAVIDLGLFIFVFET